MATITSAKRKEIEKYIYDFYNILDVTGSNTETYKTRFKGMSDNDFSKYINDMMKDDDNNFYLEAMPYDDEPKLSDVRKALKFVGSDTEEYVYYRHETLNGDPVRTSKKVPVVYLHIKKLRQVLSKKNSYSFDVSKRSALTDQVSGEDKISRNSDSESYALLAVGATNILKEISGARADHATARNAMYNSISTKGFTRLDELPRDMTEKASINILDTFLTSAGLKSDIMTEGLLLTQTMIKKDKNF